MFSTQIVVNIKAGATAVRKGMICKISSNLLVPCSAQGEAFFGVPLNDAAAGQMVAVCVAGECDVEVDDATIAVGSFVTTKASAVAEVAVTGDVIVGMALEPGAAAISSQYAYRRVAIRAHNHTV